MFRRTVVIMSVFFLTSCTASMKTTPPSQSAKVNREANEANREGQMKTEIAAVSETAQEEMQAAIGLIFAKTIFEGIVKTSYVELAIVDQSDESKKFQLIIGDKERQKNFPWEVQAVKPGYFFIELPEGQYRIKSMSIPVGTTKAQEPIDIVFDVTAKQATYLGTLKVSGTKEKIKLGGVPVLQPGFEYNLRIVDEEQEAYQEFKSRFPDYQYPIKTNLMHAYIVSNEDSNPSED